MRPDRPSCGARCGALLLAASALLQGCAAPQPPAPATVAPASPAPQPALAPTRPEPPPVAARTEPPAVEQALAYSDRLRALSPAELNQELAKLGDGGDTALGILRLAMALAQARGNSNNAKAQMQLQRILGRGDEEARVLQPLARLLSAQLAESRRSDEQLDRQAQLLRDAQRRIEQLNERLEAVRAIERSLPSRPAAPASVPGSAPERRP